MELKIIHEIQVPDYQKLRATTGWHMLSDTDVGNSLANDLFHLSVFDEDKVVGCGRIVGDGVMYFYVQDIIVIPEYQGKGIGRTIMKEVEVFLADNSVDGSFIGLMAAKGVKGFYERLGYIERGADRPGMAKVVKK